MGNTKRNRVILDILEYASTLGVVGFLFIGLNSYAKSGGEPDVLGASDSAASAAQHMSIGGLPVWLAAVLGGFLFMGIIVLITVVLSYGTIKNMKRG